MEFTPEGWHGLAKHAADRGLAFLSSPFSEAAIDLLLLDPNERESRLFRHVNALWPQSGSLARLYALGIDAYDLWLNREALMTDPGFSLRGKTGTLELGSGNRIRQ